MPTKMRFRHCLSLVPSVSFCIFVVWFALCCLSQDLVVAQDVVAPPAGGGRVMSTTEFFVQTAYFVVLGLFAVYLLVVKPAKQKEEQHKSFYAGLKKSDEVLVGGAILGRVISLKPDAATVEIAQNVRVRVVPSALGEVTNAQPAKDGQAKDGQAKDGSSDK